MLARVQLCSDRSGPLCDLRSVELCPAAVLEPCWNARAVVEVQGDVTSLCDASKSTGQELHSEVGWIINKVACGLCATAGK